MGPNMGVRPPLRVGRTQARTARHHHRTAARRTRRTTNPRPLESPHQGVRGPQSEPPRPGRRDHTGQPRQCCLRSCLSSQREERLPDRGDEDPHDAVKRNDERSDGVGFSKVDDDHLGLRGEPSVQSQVASDGRESGAPPPGRRHALRVVDPLR